MSSQTTKISKLAIASFVCGLIEIFFVLLALSYQATAKPSGYIEIFGHAFDDLSIVIAPIIFFLPIIFIALSILSITLGIVSSIRIRKNDNLEGKKYAKRGIILGIFAPILYVYFFIVLLYIFSKLGIRK